MKRVRVYLQALSEIFRYQLISKVLILGIVLVFRQVAYLLLHSAGRVAVTSGDFIFLFQTWQGWLLLVLALLILCVYVVFDLSVKILYSRDALNGKEISFRHIFAEAFRHTRAYLTPRGVLVVLYIALLVPLVGIGLPVSLTENFYIPNFITSVIYATPVYLAAYTVGMLLLAAAGIRYLFTVHEILLEGKDAKAAMRDAGQQMKKNWKSFFIQYIPFAILLGLLSALLIVAVIGIPQAIVAILPVPETAQRFLTIFLSLFGLALSGYITLATTPLLTLELTRLYLEFKDEKKKEPSLSPGKHFRRIWLNLLYCAILLVVCIPLTMYFDEIFPRQSSTEVIAHRAGGTLAPENSKAGILAAWEHGAMGSEIDVQRTLDGYYIINHDNTFERLCGVNKTPMEMTLEEIRELTISGTGEKIPTLEEMLDASRGRVKLFIELKGKSADEQMAEDVIAMIKNKGMEDSCVLISLSYPVLAYIEENAPEMETGYLYYAAFGDVTGLPMDDLILEEQPATATAIRSIHAAGKRVFVWTVNTEASMKRFLNSEADAVITDEVELAEQMKAKMPERSYVERIWDTVLYNWN